MPMRPAANACFVPPILDPTPRFRVSDPVCADYEEFAILQMGVLMGSNLAALIVGYQISCNV